MKLTSFSPSTFISFNRVRALVCTIMVLGVCACSKDTSIQPLKSEIEMYKDAISAIEISDFNLAVKRLEALGAAYPFGDYAIQGDLDLIHAYYKTNQTDELISAAEQFQQYHPTHPNVDYTFYMQGVAEMNRYNGFMTSMFKRDPARFNPEDLLRPFQYFSILTTRFPESSYVMDARQRMIYLRNKLAESCMHKVRFYEQQQAHLSALKRAESCIIDYDGAPSSAEAMQHITDNYKELGLDTQ